MAYSSDLEPHWFQRPEEQLNRVIQAIKELAFELVQFSSLTRAPLSHAEGAERINEATSCCAGSPAPCPGMSGSSVGGVGVRASKLDVRRFLPELLRCDTPDTTRPPHDDSICPHA